MTQRFATPAAFKASLEQRLRTRAAATGTDLQRLRQLVVFDRFLVRLFETFADAALLKGGLVLELRLERARTTKDVDLRLTGAPSTALERLQAAGRLDLGDHLSFEVTANSHHPTILAEGLAYDGLRFRAEGVLCTVRRSSVDCPPPGRRRTPADRS